MEDYRIGFIGGESYLLISIKHLGFGYPEGDFILQIPELSVGNEETVAIIGKSGTGKTTLLNLAAGIITPASGTIKINNEEITRFDDASRREFRIRNIGLVFQEFELLEYLTVLDNILLPYRMSPALALDASVRDRARKLTSLVGIDDKLMRNVGRLSQGERQRVAICRAVLPEPILLLCDEPTGNLDPTNTDRVLDILFEYVKSHHTTLVCVTHERENLNRFDRIIDFSDYQEDR